MNLQFSLNIFSLIVYIILQNIQQFTSLERFSQKLFDDCSKTECKCLQHINFDTIDCPATDPKLHVLVSAYLSKVTFNCSNITGKEFLNLIPHLNIGIVRHVKIIDCPLPENVTLVTLLQPLQLTNYTFLGIYMNNNNETSLTRQHLSDFYGLNVLTLNISSLHTPLPDDVFSDKSLSNLTILDLFSNNIQLPTDIFKNQRKLRNLYLFQNNLTKITNTTFQSLNELRLLSLQEDNIEVLEPNAFDSLQNLKEFFINSNKINSLPGNLFRYNKLLYWFQLDDNKVPMEKVASKLFADLPKLDTVILKCGLNSIPGELFVNSVNIRTIILADNTLETLPDTLFESQVNLIALDISNNRLRFLPDNLLQNTKQLDTLRLSNNNLVKFSSYNFQHLSALSGLHLSHNQLIDIDFGVDYKNKSDLKIVNLDYNNIKHIPRNLPNYMKSINISHNNITILNADDILYIHEVDLSSNQIKTLNFTKVPNNLTYLDLRRNDLSSLEILISINKSTNLQEMFLSENPWKCKCENLHLLRLIQNNTSLFKDSADMICANVQKYLYELQDLCLDEYQVYITLAIIACAIGLLLATVIALYYKYEEELKIWLYAHNMCPWFVTEHELDKNKKYDAFISYSSKDEAFIINYLIPALENCTPPFKLCVHERDWLIGELIPDQIIRSVEDSRRTIVVLSQNFIDSVWAKMEFKVAHTSALYERRSRIIVIIYGDIGDIDSLDKDLRLYLKMNTYLKWGDSRFWDKLHYAMPHSVRIQSDR